MLIATHPLSPPLSLTQSGHSFIKLCVILNLLNLDVVNRCIAYSTVTPNFTVRRMYENTKEEFEKVELLREVSWKTVYCFLYWKYMDKLSDGNRYIIR